MAGKANSIRMRHDGSREDSVNGKVYYQTHILNLQYLKLLINYFDRNSSSSCKY